jgi:hypothetical protein
MLPISVISDMNVYFGGRFYSKKHKLPIKYPE